MLKAFYFGAVLFYRTSNLPGHEVAAHQTYYQSYRFSWPNVNVIYKLRYLAYPSPNFYRVSKSLKFGVGFDGSHVN